jgi:hypothetical protein
MFDAGDGIFDFFNDDCKMSPNRSHLCMYEDHFIKDYGMGLAGFYALAHMCYDRWQKRSPRVAAKKSSAYPDTGVSAFLPISPQWEHASDGFREVQLCDYPEFAGHVGGKGFRIKNRAPPCEHQRRGHMRTLRDGRKVYVRPSIINKGGEKVVYRVAGELAAAGNIPAL